MRFNPLECTLRQLQYFVAVAETASFRKAADACHVSQPALSAQIMQLEGALDVQLFERRSRGILLTQAGIELLARARKTLREAEDLINAASGLADPDTGLLRFGVIPTVSPFVLPELVKRLKSDWPGLSIVWIEATTEELIEQLEEGALDGVLLAKEADIGNLVTATIGRDPFLLALPAEHALARGKRRIDLQRIDGETVLFLDDGHCFRDQAIAACSRSRHEESDYRATSLTTLLQMVNAGLGVTLIPQLATVAGLPPGLVTRPIVDPPARTIVLGWRPSAPRTATLKKIAALFAHAMQGILAR